MSTPLEVLTDRVYQRADTVAEASVSEIDMRPVSVDEMQKIKRAIAAAFALGYAAAIDDQNPARALVDRRRKK